MVDLEIIIQNAARALFVGNSSRKIRLLQLQMFTFPKAFTPVMQQITIDAYKLRTV